MASDILIVDDEADIRELVAGILEDEGHETRTAGGSDAALQSIAERVPRLVFLDIWLQGSRLDGLDLLDAIKALDGGLRGGRGAGLPLVDRAGQDLLQVAVTAALEGGEHLLQARPDGVEPARRGCHDAELNARRRHRDGVVLECWGCWTPGLLLAGFEI